MQLEVAEFWHLPRFTDNSAILGTSSPPQPIPTGEEVIRLISYYLGWLFYLQYPFYDASIHGGRAWIVKKPLRVKPLCHMAIALSACHQYLLNRVDQLIRRRGEAPSNSCIFQGFSVQSSRHMDIA